MDHTQPENQMVLSHHVSAEKPTEDLLCKSPLQKQQMILTSEPPLRPKEIPERGNGLYLQKSNPKVI